MYKFIHTADYTVHTQSSVQLHRCRYIQNKKPHSTDRLAIAMIHAYLHVLGGWLLGVEYFQQQQQHQHAALCRSLHINSGFSFSGCQCIGVTCLFLAFQHSQVIHSHWRRMRERIWLFLCHCESHFMTILHAHTEIYALQNNMTMFRCVRHIYHSITNVFLWRAPFNTLTFI